jgi:hypothetical protein
VKRFCNRTQAMEGDALNGSSSIAFHGFFSFFTAFFGLFFGLFSFFFFAFPAF